MSTTFLTELGEAEHALAEAVPLAERLAAAGDINYTEPRSLQLRVLAERGAHEQAPAIDELLATTRESGQPQDYALVLSAAVRLLLAEGHEQRASALLVELEQVVGIRADPYHAPALFELCAARSPAGSPSSRSGSWTVSNHERHSSSTRSAPVAPSSPKPQASTPRRPSSTPRRLSAGARARGRR